MCCRLRDLPNVGLALHFHPSYGTYIQSVIQDSRNPKLLTYGDVFKRPTNYVNKSGVTDSYKIKKF